MCFSAPITLQPRISHFWVRFTEAAVGVVVAVVEFGLVMMTDCSNIVCNKRLQEKRFNWNTKDVSPVDKNQYSFFSLYRLLPLSNVLQNTPSYVMRTCRELTLKFHVTEIVLEIFLKPT
jgi:hypothetical protein